MSRIVVFNRKEGSYHKFGLDFVPNTPVVMEDDTQVEYLLSTGNFGELTFDEVASSTLPDPETDPTLVRDLIARGEMVQVAGNSRRISNHLNNDDLSNKYVLLKRNGAIGDTVFVLSVARTIKSKYPTCKIGLAVPDTLVKFVRMFGFVDFVHTTAEASTIGVIERYEYVVNFEGVIEFQKKDDRDYFEAHFARLSHDKATDLEKWEVPSVFPPMNYLPTAEDSLAAEEVLNQSGIGQEPFVLFTVGTSNPLKTIHYSQAEKIIDGLTHDGDLPRVRVLVIGGERDRLPKDYEENGWVSLHLPKSITIAAALLKKARVVFGGDTGLIQLAAASGIPVVSYWGPTSPELSIAHYPGAQKQIQATVDCAPCMVLRVAFCHRINNGIPSCMKAIPVADIVTEIKKVFNNVEVISEPQVTESTLPSEMPLLSPNDVPTMVARSQFPIAVLFDGGSRWTGGGFYIWEQILALAKKRADVFVFVDTEELVYLKGEFKIPKNVHIIWDHNLAKWGTSSSAFLPFKFIVGTPPHLGLQAVAPKVQGANTKVVLFVYETPALIAAHRPGLDGEDQYWTDYKSALQKADSIWAISRTVRESLEEWIPEVKGKVRTMFPVVRTDIADTVLDSEPDNRVKVPRKNDLVLISRHMQYKALTETCQSILDHIAVMFAFDDDPMTIHVIGDKTKELETNLRMPENVPVEVKTYQNLPEVEKWALLRTAKAVIHPSLFEGFGIPVAEAMYAMVPVLCHKLNVFDEVFKKHPVYYATEKELIPSLVEIFDAWSNTEKTADFTRELREGWKHVQQHYTVNRAAHRVELFLQDLLGRDEYKAIEVQTPRPEIELRTTPPRVAVISTWNSRCGIAETTRDWLRAAKFPYKVFAPTEPESSLSGPDDGVMRVWNRSFQEFTTLMDGIVDFKPDVVHIQHEHSFFTHNRTVTETFFWFLKELRDRGFPIIITMHTFEQSGFLDRLGDAVDLIVTTKDQSQDRVKNLYHIDLPILPVQRLGFDEARQRLSNKWTARPRFVVGSFGMWGEHKGYNEFIETFNGVSMRSRLETRYMIVGYRQKNNVYASDVIRKHRNLVEAEHLSLFTDYLAYKDAVHTLCAANALVFNYVTMSHSSASAAIRTGMNAGRPIICTQSSMFDEFQDRKHVLKVPFGDLQKLTDAIMELHSNEDLCRALVNECDKFVDACTPTKISQKHFDIYQKVISEKAAHVRA